MLHVTLDPQHPEQSRDRLRLLPRPDEVCPRRPATFGHSQHGLLPRRSRVSDAVLAEVVDVAVGEAFTLQFAAEAHVLVVHERGARRRGETRVGDDQRSSLGNLAGRLTFIPAGTSYSEILEGRLPTSSVYIHIARGRLEALLEESGAEPVPSPKLLFQNEALLETGLKLKQLIENHGKPRQEHLDALGTLLVHELACLQLGSSPSPPVAKGGLAGWQQRKAIEYIEAHLEERISLSTLASLVRLSAPYFCRAFKQSFGMPPNQYQTALRIEYAKRLLATRAHSVTDVGLTIGYSETSSFSAAFRRVTGLTPRSYLRSVG